MGEVWPLGLQRFLPGNPRSLPVRQPVPRLRPPPSGSLLLAEARFGGLWSLWSGGFFKNPEENVKLTLPDATVNRASTEAGGT